MPNYQGLLYQIARASEQILRLPLASLAPRRMTKEGAQDDGARNSALRWREL